MSELSQIIELGEKLSKNPNSGFMALVWGIGGVIYLIIKGHLFPKSEVDHLLKEKDLEHKIKFGEQEVKNLQEEIAELKAEIEKLNKELGRA